MEIRDTGKTATKLMLATGSEYSEYFVTNDFKEATHYEFLPHEELALPIGMNVVEIRDTSARLGQTGKSAKNSLDRVLDAVIGADAFIETPAIVGQGTLVKRGGGASAGPKMPRLVTALHRSTAAAIGAKLAAQDIKYNMSEAEANRIAAALVKDSGKDAINARAYYDVLAVRDANGVACFQGIEDVIGATEEDEVIDAAAAIVSKAWQFLKEPKLAVDAGFCLKSGKCVDSGDEEGDAEPEHNALIFLRWVKYYGFAAQPWAAASVADKLQTSFDDGYQVYYHMTMRKNGRKFVGKVGGYGNYGAKDNSDAVKWALGPRRIYCPLPLFYDESPELALPFSNVLVYKLDFMTEYARKEDLYKVSPYDRYGNAINVEKTRLDRVLNVTDLVNKGQEITYKTDLSGCKTLEDSDFGLGHVVLGAVYNRATKTDISSYNFFHLATVTTTESKVLNFPASTAKDTHTWVDDFNASFMVEQVISVATNAKNKELKNRYQWEGFERNGVLEAPMSNFQAYVGTHPKWGTSAASYFYTSAHARHAKDVTELDGIHGNYIACMYFANDPKAKRYTGAYDGCAMHGIIKLARTYRQEAFQFGNLEEDTIIVARAPVMYNNGQIGHKFIRA